MPGIGIDDPCSASIRSYDPLTPSIINEIGNSLKYTTKNIFQMPYTVSQALKNGCC